jgi:hypothetical protein
MESANIGAAAQPAMPSSLPSAGFDAPPATMAQSMPPAGSQSAMPNMLSADNGQAFLDGGQQSLMSRAMAQSAPAAMQMATPVGLDPVAQAGSSMTSNDLTSYLNGAWDKTKAALNGAGQFVKDNKELVNLGGSMLQSMYGPQAEQMDFQKSLLQRRLANLNSPIRLGPRPITPGG